jgi:7,8-dihydropterin-6-yl-methyl-4-(beta-D-ribofuranosyl)aminobenzene 5'-phosphate synthase
MSSSKNDPLNLRESDRVEVTILVDNYTDLLLQPRKPVAKRASLVPPQGLLAEHGFSCLIRTVRGSEEHVVLMDAGISGTCLLHNAQVLNADLGRVEAVILSHGHFDHCWGLRDILPKFPRGIPLVFHPDAFLPRRLNLPGRDAPVPMPSPDEKMLREAGADLKKTREDSTLASDTVLVMGEIARTTEFEKGMPGAEALIDGQWVKDPFADDRGVAVKVKGKGLVIISGCAHAGIINTIEHVRRVTGTPKVHAVLGGFHLSGPMMASVLGPTIAAMKEIGPDYVVPMHCTGWSATNRFGQEMPAPFILNSVGTTYVFGSVLDSKTF